MKADIITIGDEILIGQITDTNSAYIANELNAIGIEVRHIISISDKLDDIKDSLETSLDKSDLIVITGGLGPTNDDITKKALAEFFNVGIIRNHQVLEHIEKLYKPRNIKLTEINKSQADVPENCITLRNRTGSAPGMLFKTENGKLLVSMPGVPFEMRTIVKEELIPYLKKNIKLPVRIQKTFLTTGIAESMMAERLTTFENQLPENFSLAYLPSPGILRLRLSVQSLNNGQIKEEFESQQKLLEQYLNGDLFGYDSQKLEEIVGDLLNSNSFTISTAESCTGGNIAGTITSIPGASAYFKGAVVAYHNNIKEKLLGVDSAILENHGAVSEEVVIQMAEGVKRKFNSDFSIATSGIAGPSGGTIEKPVGTVWIAVSTPASTTAKKFMFGEDRGRTIERSIIASLNMLRKSIEKIVEKTVEKV